MEKEKYLTTPRGKEKRAKYFGPEEILLKDGDEVHFRWRTKNLGKAEFGFCPIFKRGKLKEIYIYPLQQEDCLTHYKIELGYQTDLSIESTSDLLTRGQEPFIWAHFWCKEHKCTSFRLYVPSESKKFIVSILSSVSILFE